MELKDVKIGQTVWWDQKMHPYGGYRRFSGTVDGIQDNTIIVGRFTKAGVFHHTRKSINEINLKK